MALSRTSFSGTTNWRDMFQPAPVQPQVSYNPYIPPSQQSDVFDLSTLLDFITTLPTLRESGDTLEKVRDALVKVPPPVLQVPQTTNEANILAYAKHLGDQLYAAVGADFESFDAIRRGILIDILPVMMSGGGNNQMATLMMVMLLTQGSGGRLF